MCIHVFVAGSTDFTEIDLDVSQNLKHQSVKLRRLDHPELRVLQDFCKCVTLSLIARNRPAVDELQILDAIMQLSFASGLYLFKCRLSTVNLVILHDDDTIGDSLSTTASADHLLHLTQLHQCTIDNHDHISVLGKLEVIATAELSYHTNNPQ